MTPQAGKTGKTLIVSLQVSIFSATAYGLLVMALIYGTFWVFARRHFRFERRSYFYTLLLFILLGASGEAFVNSLWMFALGWPLWEYRLYPAHGGDISYFFPLIWGIFGTYSYMRDQIWAGFARRHKMLSFLLLGFEAIALELVVNIPYRAIFGDFIFFYTPANLGPLSHYSCLQVIPFYAAVAVATSKLREVQQASNYLHLRTTMTLYAIAIISFGYLK